MSCKEYKIYFLQLPIVLYSYSLRISILASADQLSCEILPVRFKLSQTASLQRGKNTPKGCPVYDIKKSIGEAPVIAGALGNAEYLFIDIALRSNLGQSGSTW